MAVKKTKKVAKKKVAPKSPKKTTAKKVSSPKKAAVKKKVTTTRPVKKTSKVKSSKKHTTKPASKKSAFPIVGIGASAGGLEALEQFFDNTPDDSNMAFVVIQHLAPEHKSIMGTLLKKYTKMEIVEARDNTKVKPNCVYLNHPKKDIAIMNGTLYLLSPTQAHGVRLPIDHFFRSLAMDQGERAVCIVLSGTGTDGTLGLKEIKGAGGIAMAQQEDQAKYPNMPRSAIDTGLVDYILPVEKMSNELLRYASHPYIDRRQKTAKPKENFENYLQKIFLLIRSGTGHDFTHYKRNTIKRRIERRMAVHQIEKISEYAHYIQSNPAEIETLFKDLLITVTNFFRDPKAFEALEGKVIPAILKHKKPGEPVRVWVAGCATGEEAYSHAMLFAEAMEKLDVHCPLQVFATDIDETAIETARVGVYPDSIAADVSAQRLRRFFVKEKNAYRIKKQIREMVVFATQNLIKDPPFSKLDLVSCRNVLIYMDAQLQKKIIPLFHYTLNPDGFMFLGTSETIGGFSDNFTAVNVKWKIYKRKASILPKNEEPLFTPLVDINTETRKPEFTDAVPESAIRQLAERTILQDYSLPCLLVNERYDVLYVSGKTDAFLSLPTGEPTFNVLKMAREELRYKLNTLLHKVSTQKSPVTVKQLQVIHGDSVVNFDLVVRPISEPNAAGLMMVIFQINVPTAKKTAKKKKVTATKQTDNRVTALEQELQSTKEYLQTTIEELETSNEELKSTNEELQSTNEELQSTNEELETSREELQSTNEELSTVNAELQSKVDELSYVNNDLNNLMGASDIGVLFLDNDLLIKRFTPKLKDFIRLIPTDEGRPISDIAHNMKYEDMVKDVKNVLRNLGRVEREIQVKEDSWVFMRVLPYRTIENTIDGVVITFFDITSQKKSQIAAEHAMVISEGILSTVHEPMLVLNDKIKVISANQAFYEMFAVSRKETENKRLYDLGNKQWDIPQLKKLIEEILPKRKELKDFRVEHEFARIGKKTMLLNARQIFQEGVGTKTILLAIEDITGIKQ